MKDIVALSGEHAASVLQHCGAFTLWRLDGGSVSCQKLALAWIDAGLDPARLPEPPSEKVALHRACKGVARRELKLFRLDDGGRAIVRVEQHVDGEGHDVDVRTGLRVWLRGDGTLRFVPEDHELRSFIERHFIRAQVRLSHTDISGWLVRTMRRLHAVPLRESGGVYFVPPSARPELKATFATLRQVSQHKLYAVPAVENDSETAELIVDSLTSEVSSSIAAIREGAAERGTRGLDTAHRNVRDLEAKLKHYEKLLGRNLSAVQGLIDKADDEIATLLVEKAAEADE